MQVCECAGVPGGGGAWGGCLGGACREQAAAEKDQNTCLLAAAEESVQLGDAVNTSLVLICCYSCQGLPFNPPAAAAAGGADWGLAAAVDEGSILGPRVLFTGEPQQPVAV
jgi:hypothetical protein